MKEDISENTEAIEAVAGRATTLEGEMDAVEAAVATKVETEAYNAKVAELAGEDTAMKLRLDALEEAIGEDGDVAGQIDAKIGALDAEVASVNPEEGKGLKVSAVQTDGKLVSVAVEGNFDNSYDAKGAAATAEQNAKAYADGKDNAIAEAKQAGTDAQTAVTELQNGAVKDNADAIAEIKTNMPTAIPNSKIDEMFATE